VAIPLLLHRKRYVDVALTLVDVLAVDLAFLVIPRRESAVDFSTHSPKENLQFDFSAHSPKCVISTEGGALCRRSGETPAFAFCLCFALALFAFAFAVASR
jgi:hypothetical protein